MKENKHTNVVEPTHSAKQSVGSKIVSGGIICGLALLLLFLLGNVVLYFFDRSQALLQREDANTGTQRYALAGVSGTGEQILIPLTSGSTDPTTSSNSSSTRGLPSSNQITNSGSGSMPYYVPMMYFIPQQTGQSSPVIFNQPQNPGNTTNITTTPGNGNSSTTNDSNRSLALGELVNTGNFDPAIQPGLLNDLTLPNEVLAGDVSPTLPDNILYPMVELNRSLDNWVTPDPLGKTYNYLEQSNMKTLEGLMLLEKNTGEDTDQLAVDTFKGSSDLVKKAGEIITDSPVRDTDATIVLFNGMSNQLIVQQILLQAAENIDTNLVSLEIEKVRLDHLAEVGVIVTHLLDVSDNDADVVTNLVTGSINSPVEALHTINILNDLENRVGIGARPTISLLEQTVAGVFVQELVSLPEEEQLNAVLGFAGNSPVRLIQSIETLDLLPITENEDARNITRAASDTAVNKLEKTLIQLPEKERLQFINHYASGDLEDLKRLIVMEAHLKKTLADLNDTNESGALVKEIASAKKEALEKFVTNFDGVNDISDSEFMQRLMRKPDIYDVALLNAVENLGSEKIKNSEVLDALTTTRSLALTKLVSDLGAGRTELPIIPYSGAIIADIDNDLTPQANQIVSKALNVYQKDMGDYLIGEITNKEILSRYQDQLQTVSSPVSALAAPVTAKVEKQIVQPGIQNALPQIINQVSQVQSNPSIPTNPVIIPSQPSVQETIQQVPQIVNTVTDQVVPQQQTLTQPSDQSLPQKLLNVIVN